MGEKCNMHTRNEDCTQNIKSENGKGRDKFEMIGIN
jgi:hypothetical protein